MSKKECIICSHFVPDMLINDNHEIFHGICDITKERKRFQDSCYRWDDFFENDRTMTKEEAIKQLDWMKYRFRFSLRWEQNRAFNMAIEALKVDIVYCKECKYRDEFGCHNPVWGDGWGNYPPPNPSDGEFCSFGERTE